MDNERATPNDVFMASQEIRFPFNNTGQCGCGIGNAIVLEMVLVCFPGNYSSQGFYKEWLQ